MKSFFKGKSYAIIGNGPCELGRGRGREIDSRDIVVRFNNFSLDYSVDYGIKVDAWVCTFWSDTVYTMNPGVFKEVYCPLPVDTEKWRAHYGSINGAMANYYGAIFQPGKIHDQAWKLIQSPSSGFAFLYWFYKETGGLDVNSLYGFSHFSKKEKHHYCDDQRKTGNHNGDMEKYYIGLMGKGLL